MKGVLKKLLIFLLTIVTFSMASNKLYANTDLNIDAKSYVLMEKQSCRVLEGKNINERLLPASITKILTCIVAIENGKLENYYTVTNDVVNQPGSSLYLELGEKIKLIDLLYGMMLRSGNDTAYMTAISVCASYKKFIDLMNETAKRIGMKNSFFMNPSGLDEQDENYSTAYDMGLLMAYCLNNEIFREITSTSVYTFKNATGKVRSIANKHKLIRGYDFITGGKTGVGCFYAQKEGDYGIYN